MNNTYWVADKLHSEVKSRQVRVRWSRIRWSRQSPSLNSLEQLPTGRCFSEQSIGKGQIWSTVHCWSRLFSLDKQSYPGAWECTAIFVSIWVLLFLGTCSQKTGWFKIQRKFALLGRCWLQGSGTQRNESLNPRVHLCIDHARHSASCTYVCGMTVHYFNIFPVNLSI